MAGYAATLAAIVATLTAADVPTFDDPGMVDPPCAFVASRGSDLEGIGRGQVPWSFRVVCIGGAWDAQGAARELAAVRTAALAALRAASWGVTSVSADGTRQFAGGIYLSADIELSAMTEV